MRYMAYEPGEPQFNPEGFQEPDWKDELEDHPDMFAGVDAADALTQKAEEAARLYKEKEAVGKLHNNEDEQRHAA